MTIALYVTFTASPESLLDKAAHTTNSKDLIIVIIPVQ